MIRLESSGIFLPQSCLLSLRSSNFPGGGGALFTVRASRSLVERGARFSFENVNEEVSHSREKVVGGATPTVARGDGPAAPAEGARRRGPDVA
ncbi:hypothetical protein EVAR_35266_1 [Eumeta japonica]|uniref:Uncharacterized protein n=1 Tax=Eumeta variegata TaxID=151549 RepID=A0A4C1VDS1_EUMVA|nr:hypothetical protein EVAR_35266_1 [Eumeta japonica]